MQQTALGFLQGEITTVVGTAGGAASVAAGAVVTAGVALNTANNANSTANSENTKVHNLIASTTADKENTSNYISNTSNIISTRIKNLPAPQNFVLPTASSGTSGGVKIGENININNGVISTSSPFRNIMTSSGSGQFQVVVNAGTELNNPTLGKLFITTVGISVPEIVNNTMKHHLEVNGTMKIIEATGTIANANNGSIVLDHENNGGSSSITFRSKANRGSDYGYIQYQDASVVNGCGESARLIIGTQNDADDHIILAPSGNVGIGNNDPSQKLTVQSNIQTNGAIYAISDIYAGPAYNGGFYSGDSNWGFRIHNFSGNHYWTECRGYWHEGVRGFRLLNTWNNSVPFSVNHAGTTTMSNFNVGFTSIGGDTWHNAGGRQVHDFGGDGRNYYKGSSGIPHTWRAGGDNNIMSLTVVI